MGRLVTVLLLSVVLLSPALAHAGPVAGSFRDVLKMLSDPVSVPAEWAGIWALEDSVFECTGVFRIRTVGVDTLCAGQSAYVPADTAITFTCTGTATATEIHVTCTGSMVVEEIPDCQANYEVHLDGTRTADTFFNVTTVAVTYSGTGFGCDLLPGTCLQINSHGIRTEPAPAAYCATPVRAASWGAVKAHYR